MGVAYDWTPERVVRLQELLAVKGAAQHQAADAMGVSRKVVQCQIERMRLATARSNGLAPERAKAGPAPLPAGHPIAVGAIGVAASAARWAS